MRKTAGIFALLFAGASMLTSCYKNLKDDIRDLRGQVNDISHIIGSDDPMKATTTFKDDNDSTRTISETYSFKSVNSYTQYMWPNTDGTYTVNIQRFLDVDRNEWAKIQFRYNPATKAVTRLFVNHTWDYNPYPYNQFVYYSDQYTNPAPVMNLTINRLDMATGDISLTVTASGDGAYTTTYGGPNPGKPVTTNITFTGKVKVFSRQ